MASMGKCVRCDKTVYQLEAVTVGPPRNVEIYHKSCFKCVSPVVCCCCLLVGDVRMFD